MRQIQRVYAFDNEFTGEKKTEDGREGGQVGDSFCRAILASPIILVSEEQICRSRRLLDTQKDGHFHRRLWPR